jgi:hypothetical protein
MGKYNMATTNFSYPTSVVPVQNFNDVLNINSIPWKNLQYLHGESNYATSNGPLYTISGFWQEKFYTETDQLVTTGYGFEDTGAQVLGIEALVSVRRVSRVQDLVIQLTLNGELVGDNLASAINPVQSNMYTGELDIPPTPIGDINIYGSASELWGREWASAEIADPSFGIAVSFKSNQIVPHRDLVYFDQVALRITYA